MKIIIIIIINKQINHFSVGVAFNCIWDSRTKFGVEWKSVRMRKLL